MKENFAKAKVGVKVKFDVLNRKLLEYVGEYGCRVLHLSSDIFEHDKLCIEGDFGICKGLTHAEFRDIFADKRFPKNLPVDLVVLAIP